MTPQQAQTIALNILTFLVSDEMRAEALLRVTGVSPQDLPKAMLDEQFLADVVDYALSDERLLMAFATEHGLTPESVVSARRALPGGDVDF